MAGAPLFLILFLLFSTDFSSFWIILRCAVSNELLRVNIYIHFHFLYPHPHSIYEVKSRQIPSSPISSNKMGLLDNLHSTTVVDTSVDVIGAADAHNELVLLILWIASVYAMAMIWSTCALTDRWRGPRGKNSVGLGGALSAVLLSTAWPVVLVYLMVSE